MISGTEIQADWRGRAPAAEVVRAECAPIEVFDWRGVLAGLEGAYAANTLRAYRSDFAVFEAWCANHGERALPATGATLARFVAADAQSTAPASLRRRLYAIRKVHRLLELASSVGDEVVNTAVRRARRARPNRPAQAQALNAELRDQLIAACPPTLIGRREAAMLAVAYDTLCRRAELVSLQVEDLHPMAGRGARVLVRRSKMDPFGNGRWAHLSAAGYVHLLAWLDAAGIRHGPVFRAMRGKAVGETALHAVAVNRMIKACAARAGLEAGAVAALSGHSMRIGAAQDLMLQGRDVTQIMLAGGWQSVNVVRGYLREAVIAVWSDPPGPGPGPGASRQDAWRGGGLI
jgi:integrase/recombinase XerD